MLNLDSVQIDTSGWTFDEEQKQGHNTIRRWVNQFGEVLSLHCFPNPDPSPFILGDINSFRNFCRMMALQNGGEMIEAEMLTSNISTFYKMIYKYQQQPTGFIYSGGLCISPHFVINVEAAEGASTGIRETAVALLLGSDATPGFISRFFSGKQAWSSDPYDRRLKGGFFKSDDKKWDIKFPDHPLSRVREHLDSLESSVQFRGDSY